ncbi:glutamine--tRNA ligase/YqeY domain fusion protein [Formosa algae]|uniref:Glutamine--tRNA ligase n=1 Tax=Formosa algae TaxID=225843 RepID=A0A9X1CAY9_9FLAO|nr:glutamine--tRNA ligase/YqeY domain fusion protein [Formosa algae]MBP1838670.1 glutaminyl-tRNA synthetase [Formosa algae]MDQ0335170.1 glutaminyl-tRNA synthetase [Formosa algae]OEI80421.1 glutamine--tRNA ligase [Formosa algae]
MSEETKSLNFIEHIIENDLKTEISKEDLRFRFPPEPNGYLHIGHTKAIGISFGLGERYNAPVNLRFDDTNPAKEEQEYVDAIKEDVSWLGYQWDKEVYSSDYFQQLFDWAVQLIKDGKAYVDSQSSEAMAEQKGTPTQPGVDGPFRDRTVEENLDLFNRMKAGEFDEGEHILRAKIDMQHVNMLMRDPIIYRILKKSHHRTGDTWCIYPMYDWTHGESDYIEQVSHSLCSLEFKPHRELYDWFLDQLVVEDKLRPKQREFARLNLSYTIMSKRKLLQLVEDGVVNGWDDPRMPTISGLRRRGYTPTAIRKFVETVGVAKRENIIDVSLLEFCIREDLNKTAPRVMAVLDPVKLVITNYPEDKEEWLEAENNQEDDSAGFRQVPFSRELYIERDDFKESANSKYFRLTLGKEVRLKNAYIIKGESVVKDEHGKITEIHVSYDPDTLSGSGTEASLRKVKGTLHWVSIKHAVTAVVREYDRLFMDESPDSHADKSFMDFINPDSLKLITAYVEPSLTEANVGDRFQFQRLGYFNVDYDSTPEKLIFNKTVGLRDSWAKEKPKPQANQNQNQNQPKSNQPQRKAIDVIQQFGKKYTNLPDAKREKIKADILELAEKVSYDELEPLFGTAVKKVGTRIAAMLTLQVLLKNGLERNDAVNEFIEKGLADGNALLVAEASVL